MDGCGFDFHLGRIKKNTIEFTSKCNVMKNGQKEGNGMCGTPHCLRFFQVKYTDL